MSTIYKLKHIVDNKIEHIFVFLGNNIEKKEEIFSPTELEEITVQKIKITFLDELIHKDDTIEVIKKKIIKNITIIDTSFGELTLYVKQNIQLNSINLYQSLTQNDKLELTTNRLMNFFLNIDNYLEILRPLQKKIQNEETTFYTYEDILSLGLDEHGDFLINKSLGQRFVTPQSAYPYTVNPYQVSSSYDEFLEKHVDEITTTTNKNILMDIGYIYNNDIYLCDALNTLSVAIKNNIPEKSTIKIYYPYLYEKNINSLEDLIKQKQALRIENEEILDNDFIKKTENVNLFYNIYDGRENNKSMPFIESGIKEIEFIIHPDYKFHLPLDIVFKLLHATETMPFIKYNLGKGQEKMIRLYANNKSIDGRKIPFLNKSEIFKLIKNIGRSKGVSVYIETFINEGKYNFECIFANNGEITIKTTFINALTIEKINNVIKNSINECINIIKEYISQKGYGLNNFNSILDSNIEIININYVMNIPIDTPLNLKKISGCLSSIFNVIEDNIKKGIVMRFKRVANYNDMNSQDAFIVDKINLNKSEKDIIQELSNNFNMSIQEATIKYAEFMTSVQVVQNAFNNKKIRVKNNPGFLTTIIKEQFNNIHLITINGINNIYYLDTIPIFIDSLIRIIQSPTKTTVPIDRINSLCKKTQITKTVASSSDTQINDIVAVSELPFSENKQMTIVDKELVFSDMGQKAEIEQGIMDDHDSDDGGIDDDNDDTLLSMMLGFGNQDDEDEEGNDEDIEEMNTQLTGIVGGADKDNDNDEKTKGVYWNKQKKKWCAQIKFKIKQLHIGCFSTKEEAIEAYEYKRCELYKDKSCSKKNKNKKKEVASDSDSDNESQSENDSDIDNTQEEESDDNILSDKGIKEDIVGQSLNNPNPIIKRLKKYEPSLYLTENEGKFNAYSRGCVWSPGVRRQPIILTDKEKKYIDQNHPNSYDKEIQYGTNPNKKYWYICPRYWSLKDNVSLTEKEAKSGKYGDIIPLTSKTIPPGGAIIDYGEGVNSSDFKKQYPGFMDSSKHPKGFCLPCCFSNWDAPKQKDLRKKCMIDTNLSGKKEDILEDQTTVNDEYVMNAEKYPIEPTKYGYLPLILQQFFGLDNKECQVSSSNTNLKPDHACVLRHGVEYSKNQSFIAALGDLFGRRYNKENKNQPLSIKDFKKKLLDALDLDIFMNLQNGTLIELFYKDNAMDEINILNTQQIKDEYKTTKIYQSIYNTPENTVPKDKQYKLFYKIVQSYENFKLFLGPDNTEQDIDYTYLWDLICNPNPKLFPNGINLVVLDITSDDISNKIQIICPTNHYSNHLFNEKLGTIIIIKNGNYYEPIYRYTLYGVLNTGFTYNDKDFKDSFKLINKSINNKCLAFPSMPANIYKFKKNIVLEQLIILLREMDYIIKSHVMNYDGKIVGVITTIPKLKTESKGTALSSVDGFIPCYPSGPLLNIDTEYTWLNNEDYFNTYKTTVLFLKKIKEESDGKILCQPAYKIVNEIIPGKRYVIGILTETNQFIEVSKPYEEEDLSDQLQTLEDLNYNSIDYNVINSEGVKNEINEEVHKIKLESKFFNVFRNTIRILINKFHHRNIKREIESVINTNTTSMSYIDKLLKINKLLMDLVINKEKAVSFRNYTKEELFRLTQIGTCYLLEENKCKTSLFCKNNKSKDSGSICELAIPSINLSNGKDNKELYFSKISDEILRYNRIKSFIFQSKAFLSFDDISYHIYDDELIINASLIDQEYFENLIPMKKNLFVSGNTYDSALPNITQQFTNIITK